MGCVQRLTHLLQRGTAKGKEEAAAALWNVSTVNEQIKTAIVEAGALPSLVEMVGRGTPMGRESAPPSSPATATYLPLRWPSWICSFTVEAFPSAAAASSLPLAVPHCSRCVSRCMPPSPSAPPRDHCTQRPQRSRML